MASLCCSPAEVAMRAPLCLLLAVCALRAGAVPSRADEGFCPMGTADNWLPLTLETDVPELVQVQAELANTCRVLQHAMLFASMKRLYRWRPSCAAGSPTAPVLACPPQDALAEEVSLLLDQLAEGANSTWVPCSNATVTTEGCLQSVAGGCRAWQVGAAAASQLLPFLPLRRPSLRFAAAAPARLVLCCLTLAFPASPTARLAGTNYWLRMNVSCPDYDFPDTVQLEATIYDPLDNSTRPTVGRAGCAVITRGFLGRRSRTKYFHASPPPLCLLSPAPSTLPLQPQPHQPQSAAARHPTCRTILPAPQIGLSVVEQPEGPPEGFEPLDSVPQDWVAIPDDAALFQQLPYEQEELVAAAPDPPGAADEAPAPAPSPAEDGSGGEEELPTEEELDPATQEEYVDAEQLAEEEEQRRR